VLLQVTRILVMGGQRMPVGDEEEALVVVLQLDPVLQHTVVVAQMQAPGGAHAGDHALVGTLVTAHGIYPFLSE